ncbi:DUF397 domain-containing protein [Streptomyces griseoaurantiacus]|uniref:DUF397 domain-containing protein n=1 Tax=Streptomyces griseoaurantiacus TaxID=68213 RepID=A0A7W2DNT2_9ACTN|nr:MULTISPECIES: DUF397 domain-containing protein [Streptomyces]MBA5219932.1 DUF397 domain-containing protein [Streptomyces griseoaurantiacus]MDX3091074.1 DUF397 domain-containing protein [Streptomyces sp. ME12-02E]MDX3334609.1 DUF397 domain-containing protein [Streptomyces sp. ME02-6978a]
MAHSRIDLSDAQWGKSSHSNGDGRECVEAARDLPGAAAWRRSSYSNGSGGDCVEVADNVPGLVPVRDSKLPDTGPVLLLTAHAWAPFVTSLKATAVS